MDPLFIIPLIALAYVAATVTIQRKVSNMQRVREQQQAMKDKMKELNGMIKSNADKAQIDEKNRELSAIASDNMKMMMKSTFVILPISLIVFYYLLPMGFAKSGFTIDILSFKLNYQGYFIAIAVVAGLVASSLLSLYDKRKLKQKNAANANVTTSS